MTKTLNIRLPDHEAALLAAYALKTKRTRSEIVRAYIRSLASKSGGRTPRFGLTRRY